VKKQLQGIGLILFGILLCVAEESINYTLLSSMGDFPFSLAGICVGIAGLVFLFRMINRNNVKGQFV